MRHIIVATHGEMANGIIHSVELIMGKQECLHALAAYTQDCMDFHLKLKQLVEDLVKESEVFILTDLLGGSVNNEAISMLPSDNVHIIAGVNIALLIQLLENREEGSADTVIQKSIQGAKEAIVYCNTLIDNSEKEIELDQF